MSNGEFVKFFGLLMTAIFVFGCATTNAPVTPAGSTSTSASKLTPEPNDDIRIENGTIDKEAIRGSIREARRSFQNCYNQALKRNSKAGGKIEIQWDIEEKGDAGHAVVRMNLTGDDEFGQCVKKQIEKTKFPIPPKEKVVRVVFPFIFDSKGELAK